MYGNEDVVIMFEFFLFFMTLLLLFVIAILGSIKEILDRSQFR